MGAPMPLLLFYMQTHFKTECIYRHKLATSSEANGMIVGPTYSYNHECISYGHAVYDVRQNLLRRFWASEGNIRQENRLLVKLREFTDGQRKALTDFLEALSHQD